MGILNDLNKKSLNFGTDISIQEVIQTNANKCVTDYNSSFKKLNILTTNPYLLENFTEKQILDIANNYITTDESLELFQKQIEENTSENVNYSSVRIKNMKNINKIDLN